jgi:di- and tripeptidase
VYGANETQKFNEHYETISSFNAHDGLILASAFTKYKDKPTLVTGGNDDTIVIWEVRDCTEPNAVAKRNNNGRCTHINRQSSTYHIQISCRSL